MYLPVVKILLFPKNRDDSTLKKNIVHKLQELTIILMFDIQIIKNTEFSRNSRKLVFGVDPWMFINTKVKQKKIKNDHQIAKNNRVSLSPN